MRIVIDMQGAQSESRFRGIGRYSLSLVQAIARKADKHEVWLALNARLPESIPDLRAAFSGLIPAERIHLFDVPCHCQSSPWLARASELVRESFLDYLLPDVVLVTSIFEGFGGNAVTSIGVLPTKYRTVAILYDLIPLLNPEEYLPNAVLRDYYYRKVGWLKKADLLLAISESSRQEGGLHLGLSPEKMWNISAAIGSQFYPRQVVDLEKQVLLGKLGIQRKPVLYAPGGFDPRKNFARLIEAYSRLERVLREQYQLVIVSKLNPAQCTELTGLATRFGLSPGELVLTGYVEDDDLIALYSLAELFVFPSTHEGFGLPVLEAMACGAAVIGSNCSSIPEVIGNSDALFDPFSVHAIADKMAQVLTDTTLRDRLRVLALNHAKKFSWDHCASEALQAMEELYDLTAIRQEHPRESLPTVMEALANIADGRPADKELYAVAKSLASNQSQYQERQLLLDVSTIVRSDAKSGIQRVVRSLLLAFLETPPHSLAIRPVYFDKGIYRYASRFTARLMSGGSDRQELEDLPVDYARDDVYLSLDLNMHLAREMHPLHEWMQLMGVKLNFIVYDLLLAKRPDWWPAPNPMLFDAWLRSISQVGHNLVCISRSVANELDEWLERHPPERWDDRLAVSSFHLGADIDNSLPTTGLAEGAEATLKEVGARPSFLMVGTIEPRKGYAQAIAAFEQLWDKHCDVNLVIVGKRGWMVDEIIHRLERHPEKNLRLFWLMGVSDEYLEKIYAASTCLITASEGEGFGLPLIEAAQHQLPIIARDIPVFREVAGEHAYYFSGLEVEDLAVTIQRWLELYEKGEIPTSVNMPWLTWKQSAQQLLKAIFPAEEVAADVKTSYIDWHRLK